MSDTAYIATPHGRAEVDVTEWVEIFGQRAFLHRDVTLHHSFCISEYKTGRQLGAGSSYARATANARNSIRTRARNAHKSPGMLLAETIARQPVVNGVE